MTETGGLAMTNLTELRETTGDGTLPRVAWPGAYPLVYLTAEGETVCPQCANDPDTDPVTDADIHWEGAPILCADCGEPIVSAYGDPDNITDEQEA